MPDLSSPKWERREKLNRINFANKGRKGGGSTRNIEISPNENLKAIKEILPAAKLEDHLSNENEIVQYRMKPESSSFYPAKIKVIEKLIHDEIQKISKESSSELTAQLAHDLLEDKDVFRDISSSQFVDIISLNAKEGRVEQAQKTFDLMIKEGIKPSVISYNSLMNAYSQANDIKKCIHLVEEMKFKQLSPDTYTYGILIKALVKNKRITDAFAIYSEMKESKMEITLPIYSMLINGCTKIRDYNRAWKLFDHMRSVAHRPDKITYNQMIHICAITGEAEKALSLFDQMKSYGFYPSISSFNSLIHACSRRPDLYSKTFDIVQQMQESGYTVDEKTYNYMLGACAIVGDIKRCKLLYDELTENVTDNPGVLAKCQLLNCYSRVPIVVSKLEKFEKWAEKMDKFSEEKYLSEHGLMNEERISKGVKPVDINDWLFDPKYDPDEKFSLSNAYGKSFSEIREYLYDNESSQYFLENIKQEVDDIIKPLLTMIAQKPINSQNSISVALPKDTVYANSVLKMLGSFGRPNDLLQVFNHGFDILNLKKDSHSFLFAIQGLVNALSIDLDMNAYFMKESLKILSDYESYRKLKKFPANWKYLDTKYIRNKLLESGINPKHRLIEYYMYTALINGLSMNNDLNRAISLFRTLIDRGHASCPHYSVYHVFSAENELGPQYHQPMITMKMKHFDKLREQVEIYGTSSSKSQFQELYRTVQAQLLRTQENILRTQSIKET